MYELHNITEHNGLSGHWRQISAYVCIHSMNYNEENMQYLTNDDIYEENAFEGLT